MYEFFENDISLISTDFILELRMCQMILILRFIFWNCLVFFIVIFYGCKLKNIRNV